MDSDRLARSASIMIIGLVSAITFFVGCSSHSIPITESGPILAPGFLDKPIPDADINGYLYVNQGTAFKFPLASVLKESAVESELGMVSVKSLVLWTGPELQDFGMGLLFANSNVAELLAMELRLKDTPIIWHQLRGNELFLVNGSSAWATHMITVLSNNRFVKLDIKYPETWKTLQFLPKHRTKAPIATGFFRITKHSLSNTSINQRTEIRDIASVLRFLRVKNIGLSLYSESMIDFPFKPDFESLTRDLLGVDLVSQAGYPGFLIDIFFENLASRIGLEKTTDGKNVSYHRHLSSRHLMVQNKGNLFRVSIANNQQGLNTFMSTRMK